MSSYILLCGPVLWVTVVLFMVMMFLFIVMGMAYINTRELNEKLQNEKDRLVVRLESLIDKHKKETFKNRLKESGELFTEIVPGQSEVYAVTDTSEPSFQK